MSVYLKDSLVLLDDSGNVATSEDCCCGCPCTSIDVTSSATAIITDDLYGPGCVILNFSDSTTAHFDTCDDFTAACHCCIDSNTEICSCGTLPGRFGEACYAFTISNTEFVVAWELAVGFCADSCSPEPCPFESDYFINCSTPHTIVLGTNSLTDHCEIVNGGEFGTINGTIDISTTVLCNS